MSELYLMLIAIIFIYMSVLFLIAQKLKNNSIVDVGWPFGFVIIAFSSLLMTQNFTLSSILMTVFVGLWGLRLGIYLWVRAYGKPEDYRYANFRKQWGKNVVLTAFFRVFMLQGSIMLLVAFPIIVTVANSEASHSMAYSILGSAVWLLGYFFQVIGDAQLAHFKKQRKSKEEVLQTGLWAYTRHPNYFGEACMWWGLAIIALPVTFGFIALLSALIMNILLVKVSGVPFLDRRYAQNAAYQHYKQTTNRFVPWFPKQIKN